jgi:hypothetical protein
VPTAPRYSACRGHAVTRQSADSATKDKHERRSDRQHHHASSTAPAR